MFLLRKPLAGELIHVDQVIPRTFLNHDEIWNLVLAQSSCNLEKSARLPSMLYLIKLYERKGTLLPAINPIKKHLIAQMGPTPEHRRALLERIYRQAEKVLIPVWPGKGKELLQTHPLTPLQTDCSAVKSAVVGYQVSGYFQNTCDLPRGAPDRLSPEQALGAQREPSHRGLALTIRDNHSAAVDGKVSATGQIAQAR